MALTRGRLNNNVVNVAAGTTVGIVTVSNNKKVYVKKCIFECIFDKKWYLRGCIVDHFHNM